MRGPNSSAKVYTQEFKGVGKKFYPVKDGVADMGRPVDGKAGVTKWCQSVGNDNDMKIKPKYL